MKGVVSIAGLLQAKRAEDSLVAWSKKEEYSWADFCHAIYWLVGEIKTKDYQRCLIASDDSYGLALGVLATLYAGGEPILPANLQRGHLRDLAKDALVISNQSTIAADIEVPPSPKEIGNKTIDKFFPNIIGETIQLYTSGSSGKPTAIVKPIRCLDAEVGTLEESFGSKKIKAMLATVPPYHIYGLLFRVLWPLLSARPFAADQILYPDQLEESARRPGAVLISSPAFLKRAHSALNLEKLDQSLRGIFSSGGPLDEEVSTTYNKALTHPIIEVYGSTETGGIAYRSVLQREPTTLWRPFTKVKLQAGENDTLQVQSPNIAQSGWFQTADIAIFNEKGLFELKGRVDRIIKIEERRISLTEIENQLKAQPSIKQVFVLPLQEQGRQVLAAVVMPNEIGWEELATLGKRGFTQKLHQALLEYFPSVVLPKKWRFIKRPLENAQGKITQERLINLFVKEREKPILPKILSQQVKDNVYQFEIHISEDIIYFDGHFDDWSVLPGIAQVHWAIDFALTYMQVGDRTGKLESVKFSNPIYPKANVLLRLSYNRDKHQLSFTYSDGEQKYSFGKVLFDS